jgi:DNA-binding MarR family transcriptional regulator
MPRGLSTRHRRLTSTGMVNVPTPCPDPESTRAAEQLLHLARMVHGARADNSLTPAQWTALRYFARANRFSRSPSAFSEFHATTRGTASQTVRSLVALGLLERHASETDGRGARIEVTPAGLARLSDDPLEALCRLIDALPAASRAVFSGVLGDLASGLARQQGAPVFGNCTDCGHCEAQGSGGYCRCTQSMLDGGEMATLCVDFVPGR